MVINKVSNVSSITYFDWKMIFRSVISWLWTAIAGIPISWFSILRADLESLAPKYSLYFLILCLKGVIFKLLLCIEKDIWILFNQTLITSNKMDTLRWWIKFIKWEKVWLVRLSINSTVTLQKIKILWKYFSV